jgi:hypothetical protein
MPTYAFILGHATVGGMGTLTRMWGLLLDSVVEAEVVIASGDIVVANESTNAGLFWMSLQFMNQTLYTDSISVLLHSNRLSVAPLLPSVS